jgi:hypothetical protein
MGLQVTTAFHCKQNKCIGCGQLTGLAGAIDMHVMTQHAPFISKILVMENEVMRAGDI